MSFAISILFFSTHKLHSIGNDVVMRYHNTFLWLVSFIAESASYDDLPEVLTCHLNNKGKRPYVLLRQASASEGQAQVLHNQVQLIDQDFLIR